MCCSLTFSFVMRYVRNEATLGSYSWIPFASLKIQELIQVIPSKWVIRNSPKVPSVKVNDMKSNLKDQTKIEHILGVFIIFSVFWNPIARNCSEYGFTHINEAVSENLVEIWIMWFEETEFTSKPSAECRPRKSRTTILKVPNLKPLPCYKLLNWIFEWIFVSSCWLRI